MYIAENNLYLALLISSNPSSQLVLCHAYSSPQTSYASWYLESLKKDIS